MSSVPILEATDYPGLSLGYADASFISVDIVGLDVKLYGLKEVESSTLPLAAVVSLVQDYLPLVPIPIGQQTIYQTHRDASIQSLIIDRDARAVQQPKTDETLRQRLAGTHLCHWQRQAKKARHNRCHCCESYLSFENMASKATGLIA